MKKLLKIFLLLILSIVSLMVLFFIGFIIKADLRSGENLERLRGEAPVRVQDGVSYRDLNKNGKRDVYEDSSQPTEARVTDLLRQMTLEEKAGMMFIFQIEIGADGSLAEVPRITDPITWFVPGNTELITRIGMNSFNIYNYGKHEPAVIARWYNNIQKIAERTRLGIPLTLASNPMHGATSHQGAVNFTKHFSHWPSPLGLAATRDSALVREFADIVRQEYRAVGIRLALHPSADLATEPRWSRTYCTFGEDAVLASQMLRAYIQGLQGDCLGIQSVAAMAKHFSGGGPHQKGEDSHFPYGKNLIYPGNHFNYHLIPFEDGVFPTRAAQIMPYYAIPSGQTGQDVAFAFNKEIITGLLREKYGFDGVVCTDWNLLTHYKFMGVIPADPPKSWGVENLTLAEKARMIIEAGCDQFGGEFIPGLIVELVKKGQVAEIRINQSVRRILRDKFTLGLFDNPYVKPGEADKIVRKPEFVAKGELAQRKSIVLLKNDTVNGAPVLPIKKSTRLYLENIDPVVASKYARVVSNPDEADLVIMRIATPYEKRNQYIQEDAYHQGRLDFEAAEKKRILDIIRGKPAIVNIYLDRPAVIPEIATYSKGVLAEFGVADEALLDVIFGRFNPQGKLPFEMPSSAVAVAAQQEDVPYDSKNPLFPFGHGLSYSIVGLTTLQEHK